jgi:hypothetical protein
VTNGDRDAARPVIVRRDALANGVPSRDLRLTRAHSLYLDQMLVPVEYLINGFSILWDDAACEVELYHIELAEHDVLIADGAAAESYRADGNRHLFDNADDPRHTTSATPWYAPVITGGPALDDLWLRLRRRSGFVPPALIDDPDLHLLVGNSRLPPTKFSAGPHPFQGTYRFCINHRPVAGLRIASRYTVPALTGIGRDPRRLGVAIRSIVLRDTDIAIDLQYHSRLLSDGFHAPEYDGRFRWTDGHALLPPRCLAQFEGSFEVVIEVACTTKYPELELSEPPVLATAA